MAKVIHLRHYDTIRYAPESDKIKWSKENCYGTLCGYVRSETTPYITLVTCKACLKKSNG